MTKEPMDALVRAACCRPVMSKLDRLARELGGVGLLVVWSDGTRYRQIPLGGNHRELPRFCRLLHGASRGMERCVTCHSLLALSARSRGQVTQGCCHGGACVVAAPALDDDIAEEAELVVISSCAFMLPDRKKGWIATRKMAKDLGLNLGELRTAYDELPTLRGKKLKVVSALVDVAAAAVAEALHHQRNELRTVAGGRQPVAGVAEKMRSALQAARTLSGRSAEGWPQVTVVEVVRAVVGANPQLPMTVADIARAAHMTPNYFSLVFRRETGQTFTAFLAETSLAQAKERLRDLTLSIGQVARQSGFSDPNYFAKVFRSQTGMAPSRWRKKAQSS